MNYKTYEVIENAILVKGVKNFNLKHIFECGQCFRWNKTDQETFIGIAFGRVIEVKLVEEDLIIYNSTEKDFLEIWEDYFDLKRDYGKIKEELSKDPLLKKAVEFGYGIRLLQQEPFEITISFIISANNRIPMIKKVIDNISRKWGTPIEYNNKVYYSFPDIEKLREATIEELENCSTGFRGKYIKDTVEKLYNREYSLEEIKTLKDSECHKAMQQFSGIGPKVSDCIILFSMGKYSAFPVDVWVKRAMQHFYLAPDVSLNKIREFAINKFGEMSGFAQQYLFYYARENNIKVE